MDYTENLKLEVATTSYVMEKNSPIVYVSHDDEGNWTFLSADDVEVSDAMLVTLEDIVVFDPTVVRVLTMPLSHEAYRKDKNSDWIIVAKN